MKNPFICKEGKNYQLYYFVKGHRKKITTGTGNKHAAGEFLKTFLINDLSVIEYSYIKASEYLKEWIELKADKKPSTIESYKNAFNELIRICGNKNLNQYTLNELNKFLLSKKGYTSRKYKVVLNAAFEYAIKLRYLKRNPFIDTINVKAVKPPVLQYNDNDLKKLFNVIDNEIYKDVALFGFYSGMRLSEILNIRKENIVGKLIILPTSKEDAPRVISIANELNVIIEKRITTSKEFLFEQFGRQLIMRNVSHIFSKYTRRAGINPKLNFHCLRKTYGSRLLNSGVNIKIVSEMLGHSSVSVTEKFYAELLKSYRSEVNNLRIE